MALTCRMEEKFIKNDQQAQFFSEMEREKTGFSSVWIHGEFKLQKSKNFEFIFLWLWMFAERSEMDKHSQWIQIALWRKKWIQKAVKLNYLGLKRHIFYQWEKLSHDENKRQGSQEDISKLRFCGHKIGLKCYRIS